MSETSREAVIYYLKNLRDTIVKSFESIEDSGKFARTNWDYKKGSGGGEMSVLRGQVFEKAAVNWSGVGGPSYPGPGGGSFFATGVSLITHMTNPMVPTVHFNIRYIETERGTVLGGGFDLTPMGFPFEEDTRHFHDTAKTTLAPFAGLYEKFSAAAKDYFCIKHYGEERGVGGIFFDQYKTDNIAEDMKMWRAVGDGFLNSIMPIYKKRVGMTYSEADKLLQLKRRGRYVEFNLLYDRGTKFGFESGGNPEAILCSMPPLVSW